MEVNFELLNVFYNVAKIGNITKAANYLYVSQPAVTKSIKKLEDTLDITLFSRSRTGVTLTYEGKILFDYIEPHIKALINSGNKLTSIKDLNEGSITIGAGTAITRMVLLPAITKFNEKYPNINIKIIHSISSNLIRDLQYGILDLILLNLPYSTSKNLLIRPCKTVHDCFVAHPKYKKDDNSKINISDLNNYPLILQQKISNTRRFLDDMLFKHNIILNPKFELSSITLVKDFVKSGLGIGYLPNELVKDELKSGELVKMPVSLKIPSRNIGIITDKENMPNHATQEFIKIILENNA
jgi:DNA-binding transcriptional LysR family regulator